MCPYARFLPKTLWQILSLCQLFVIRTDFDLDPVMLSTHDLQDRMLLQEDEASIDLNWVEAAAEEPTFPGGDQFVEDPNQDRLNSLSVHQSSVPGVQPGGSADPDYVGQRKRSRASLRRERGRGRSPPRQSKKQRMEEGRVRKAKGRIIETDVEVEMLKPGLNLGNREKRVYTKEELEKEGVKVVPWDGM